MIENYHIKKSDYGIVTLLINTTERWLDHHVIDSLTEFAVDYYNEETLLFTIVIKKEELNLDVEKEGMYLRLELQEKDQLQFYWIPLRLLKGDQYAERVIQYWNKRKNKGTD